ncbi:MAG: DUF72 domain-containing protein [Candidatus Njordarchaeota archaeon]
MRIIVGLCAFKKKYYTGPIKCVEIQQTFYNIPRQATVEKWRTEAPDDFIFNVKAFQGLTHAYTSPTWRRYSKKLSDKQKELVGDLKLNELTKQWIDTYVEFARILNARVLLIQTPKKFAPTNENFHRAQKFFDYLNYKIDEYSIEVWIGWEPRGEWLQDKSKLEKILRDIPRLIHVVDPLFHEPVLIKRIGYFRLHGRPYLNYKYRYMESDLREILAKLNNWKDMLDEVFIMFNNIYMEKDALLFKKMVERKNES